MMRAFALPVLACFAFALSPLNSLAQSLRFDMGPPGSPVAAGFRSVGPTTLYAPPSQTYGWLSPPTTAIARPGARGQFALEEENFPAALVEDSAASGISGTTGQPADFTFQVDVNPGLYWCFAYLGDLGNPAQGILTPLEGMDILVNGSPVVEGAFAQLLLDKASHWQARGGYKRVAFLVDASSQSQLFFRFKSAVDNPLSLMGLEILPWSEPPVAFDRSQQQLVVGSSYTGNADLVRGVDRMNQHDYALARVYFDAVADPLARAWGHAWWLGWLTAEEEAVDEALLQQTRESLEAGLLLTPDDAALVGLLYELRDFQWGELFLRNRGYANFPNPKSLGNLLLNLCASAQFLEQMSGDLLSDAAIAHETQSPFFAKAQYLLARNMYSRNTHFSEEKKYQGQTISFEKFGLYTLAIFDALWPRLDPSASASDRIFPEAYEALMLTYRIQQGRPPPGLWYPLGDWDGSLPALTQQEFENTWWFRKGYTDIPAPSGASAPWADYQRQYAELLRNAGRWWIQEREIDGELGGGTGDDVEAAALVVPRLTVTEGFSDFVEGGFKRVLDTVIEASDFDEPQGYVNYVTDSAHGGENASFPLLFYLPLRYGDARYLNQAMHNIRNMDEFSTFPGEGTHWTGTPHWVPSQNPGRRLFRSFWFSSTQLTGNTERRDDIPMNYRSILGGFSLMDYNGSPRTVEIFEEHARAWADAAMSTAPSHAAPKPAGVIPISIEYETGFFGEPPANGSPYEWWSHGQPNSGSLGSYNEVLYTALHDAYLRSTASDRKELIRPLHEAVNFVDANPPDENALAPDNAWVSHKIHKAVTSVARRARLDLEAEFGTSPVVIDNLIALYASDYAKYLDLPAGQPGGKPKDSIESTWQDAATWLQYFFPLATVTVSYTDRIKLVPRQPNALKALHGLYAMRGGAQSFEFIPTGPISWKNPDPNEGPLDVALLVNEYTPSDPSDPTGGGRIKILAHNYASTPKQLRMKLWRVLTPGTYQITLGPDPDFDDQIEGPGLVVPPHDFTHKGASVDLTLPSDTPFVIELVQTSASGGPPPQLDLGLSEDLFRLADGHYAATVSNLGTLDYAGGATLELTAEAGTESVSIPPLPAPGIPGITGLDAQTWSHQFGLQPTLEEETAVLRIIHGAQEITQENNHASKTFVPEPAFGSGLLAGLAALWALGRRRPTAR